VRELFAGQRNAVFNERFGVLIGTDVPDDKLLAAMSIDYISPADAANLPLDSHTVDLHVSHTVMEHIPAGELSAILTEARRILRPGGLLIHNIDPSDHFAHDDDTITRINFLQFGDSEWKALAGNRFMYHNRLRALDYVRLFEESGVRILKEERSVDNRSKAALRSGFVVDARFNGLSDDDLATTTISIMGRFS
jgi:SAM-dependent methyltransferase